MEAERSESCRPSITTWTPSRCENTALQDDRKDFFGRCGDSLESPAQFTPRRSSRFRQMPVYPRETYVNSGKRRKRGKAKGSKRDESMESNTESGCDTPGQCGAQTDGDSNTGHLDFDSTRKWLPKIKVEICSPGEGILAPVETEKLLIDLNTPKLQVGADNGLQKIKDGSEGRSKSTSAKKRKMVTSVYAPYFSLSATNSPKSNRKSPRNVGSSSTAKATSLRRSRLDDKLSKITKSQYGSTCSLPQSTGKERKKTPQKFNKSVTTFLSANKSQLDQFSSITDHIYQRFGEIEERHNQDASFDSTCVDRNTPVTSKFSARRDQKLTPKPLSKNPTPASRNMKPQRKNEMSRIPIWSVKPYESQLTHAPKVIEFQEVMKEDIKRDNKVVERRNRNVALYKKATRQNERKQIIQGVRSNRRFELQMMYRDQYRCS